MHIDLLLSGWLPLDLALAAENCLEPLLEPEAEGRRGTREYTGLHGLRSAAGQRAKPSGSVILCLSKEIPVCVRGQRSFSATPVKV